MTFAQLNELIKKHNIPVDVHLLSDSGWECDETEMNGVWFNRERNEIIFTQGDFLEPKHSKYGKIPGWELLHHEKVPPWERDKQ